MYFFVQNLAQVLKKRTLTQADSGHLFSLRPRIGEIIRLTDFQGNLATINITFTNKKTAEINFELVNQQFVEHEEFYQGAFLKPKMLLLQATLAKEYMEKMFEILPHSGFQRIIFFESEFSQKGSPNQERLNKILIRSGEQSQSLYLPEIEFLSYEQVLKLLAALKPVVLSCTGSPYLGSGKNAVFDEGSANYLIGPEGGWSNGELATFQAQHLEFVNLGNIVYPSWLMSAIV